MKALILLALPAWFFDQQAWLTTPTIVETETHLYYCYYSASDATWWASIRIPNKEQSLLGVSEGGPPNHELDKSVCNDNAGVCHD